MLRQHSRAWLSALCGAFASTASEERGPLAAAITAYAAIADAETAAQYFRIAIQKLIKVCVDCLAMPSRVLTCTTQVYTTHEKHCSTCVVQSMCWLSSLRRMRHGSAVLFCAM